MEDKENKPIIVESETSNLVTEKNTSEQVISERRKKTNPLLRVVFIILGVVIIAEIVYGIRTLTSPLPAMSEVDATAGAKVRLLSDTYKYKVNEDVPTYVNIDTYSQNTTGADVILKYDPTMLEATTSSITRGNIYGEYPQIIVENGTITLSATFLTVDQTFNGVGNLAGIRFKALKPGNTTVSVDFQPGPTVDSNLMESETAQDIISSVENLNLVITD